MQKPTHIAVKEFLVNSPEKSPKGIFLLAHGAGRGAASPFLETVAQGAVNSGVRVVRFNFPYMEGMLQTGKKKPPNSGKILRKCFSDVVLHCIESEQVPSKNIIVGGKSMGARAASMIADKHQVGGVVCLSYPFHPPQETGTTSYHALTNHSDAHVDMPGRKRSQRQAGRGSTVFTFEIDSVSLACRWR